MTQGRHAIVVLALAVAACSPPESEMTPSGDSADSVPADLAAIVADSAPGIAITSGELNASGNQFEVTGTMPNGDEVEVDMVQMNGAWAVLEIQRDIPWSSVPAQVRETAAAAPDAFEPVRVIESTQVEDGSLVYELFRPRDANAPPRGPDLEVRWHEGRAEALP